MAHEAEPAHPRPVEQFREYLHLLARLQLGAKFQTQLDPSDLVQQALLRAHEKQHQFRGRSEGERAAWLRAILASTLADAVRKLSREPGQAKQEMLAALNESSSRLEAWLADQRPAPAEQAARHEELFGLAEALALLPAEQRLAIELRHLQGWAVPRISHHMDRSIPAVAGLLRRGLKKLRESLGD